MTKISKYELSPNDFRRVLEARIKPCPFCGSRPTYTVNSRIESERYEIRCTEPTCFAVQYGNSVKQSIERWNRRN